MEFLSHEMEKNSCGLIFISTLFSQQKIYKIKSFVRLPFSELIFPSEYGTIFH
jgi:hypothetical protein